MSGRKEVCAVRICVACDRRKTAAQQAPVPRERRERQEHGLTLRGGLPSTGRMPEATRVSPPGLDLARLAAYLFERAPELAGPDLSAELAPGGKSNLTYVV